MKSEFTIAKVVRPHGVNGAMRAETYTSSPLRFKKLKEMSIDNVKYPVESVSVDNSGYMIVKLKGIDDMDTAEKMRGRFVVAMRADLPELPDGRYYIDDLIGSDVLVDGEKIGVLTGVNQYGSADVYDVKIKNGSVSFPAIKDVFKSVDVKVGEINIDAYYFQRVAVYNLNAKE